jgi:hypothetical protein
MINILKSINKTNKFYFIVFTLILTSFSLTNAQTKKPSEIPDVSGQIETQYTTQICQGSDNIVAAGCSVIGGQVVRGVPAMVFGASFDKMKGCLQKYEGISANSTIEISGNDTCSQLGYINPNLDKKNYTFIFKEGIPDNPSLFGMIDQANSVNTNLIKNSFDTSYYATKSVENIPYIQSAFAQAVPPEKAVIEGAGGKLLQGLTYNVWVSTRNVAFILLGVLSIVLGITLMSSNSFIDRNAKWRISLEQALPKVIIAVILIQLSYTFGDILLGIADNQSFKPIISYVLNNGQPGGTGEFWLTYAATQSTIFTVIAGLATFWLSAVSGVGLGVIIIILVVGIICAYRMIIMWYLNFSAILGIVLITIASPLLIAMSLLPGEAGGNQLKRYFASLISLTSQTFLYQAIQAGTVFLAAYVLNAWFFNASVTPASLILSSVTSSFTVFLLVIFLPVLVTLIYGYAENVRQISNDFAKSLVGVEPIGASSKK